MSYSSIDLSENAQDNRYLVTNDFGLLYEIRMKLKSLMYSVLNALAYKKHLISLLTQSLM